MGKMHQIIQFHTFVNMCRAHSGAVDGGVGSDFHVVVDNHIAHLRNLLVMSVGLRGKTKAIRTKHRTCVEDTILANDRVAIQFHAWIQHRIVTNDTAIANIHLRIKFHIVADFSILAHEGKLAKIQVFTALR